MEGMRVGCVNQGTAMDREETQESGTLQPLRQEKAVEGPPSNTRNHGRSLQQRLIRSTASRSTCEAGRRRGQQNRRSGASRTGHMYNHSREARGASDHRRPPQPSSPATGRQRTAGASRCHPATADVRAPATQRADTPTQQQAEPATRMKRLCPGGFPSGFPT